MLLRYCLPTLGMHSPDVIQILFHYGLLLLVQPSTVADFFNGGRSRTLTGANRARPATELSLSPESPAYAIGAWPLLIAADRPLALSESLW